MRNIASCIPLFTPSDTHFDRGVAAKLISQLAAALWYVGKGGLVAQRLEQRTHNASDGVTQHHAERCITPQTPVFVGYLKIL